MIDYACREWDFFQLIDHGIDHSVIAQMQKQMHCFFSLNADKKRQVIRTETNPWGYFDEELTKNTRDWKQMKMKMKMKIGIINHIFRRTVM
jgi:isopenicillin N synthase-like dioxygenase